MAVNLSFIGGAGWQFFDDNGDPLSGGKIFTYAAGTTTPLATYTSRDGLTANTNPIILDAAGRTPQEIWSTEGLLYKYVVKTSADVLIRSWDNIGGSVVASDLAADLASTSDNAKGDALVGFKQSNISGFLPGATARTVNAKLQEVVSVKDFGAVGDGVADDTTALQAALNSVATTGKMLFFPVGDYKITDTLTSNAALKMEGESRFSASSGARIIATDKTKDLLIFGGASIYLRRITFVGAYFSGVYADGAQNGLTLGSSIIAANDCSIEECWFFGFPNAAINAFAVQGAVIKANFIENSRYGIYSVYNIASPTGVFANNILTSNRFYAVGGNASYAGCAIYLDGGSLGNASVWKWNTITANVFDYVGIATSTLGAVSLHNSSNANVISSNIFNNQRTNDITVDNCFGVLINANQFSRSGREAIVISNNSRYTQVLNNQISSANYLKASHSASLSAITIDNSDYSQILNNAIWSFAGEERIDYGIAGANTPQNTTASDNDITGALISSVQSTVLTSGSFTPVVYGSTVAGTNTYSVQNGIYARQDNQVFFSLQVTMATKDAAMAGDIRISGLPLACRAGAPATALTVFTEQVTLSAGRYVAANIQANDTFIRLISCVSAGAAGTIGDAAIAATSSFVISGSYFV